MDITVAHTLEPIMLTKKLIVKRITTDKITIVNVYNRDFCLIDTEVTSLFDNIIITQKKGQYKSIILTYNCPYDPKPQRFETSRVLG
jgi:hypothetical protein